MSGGHYTSEFFEHLRDGARRSAEVIVPIILEIANPSSVVDVGCGDGSWLAIFRKYGVGEILGIDGDYLDRGILQIPADRFQPVDLRKPFNLARSFDLAISLEVAEHLPPECAEMFVQTLTRLAPMVLFSAAIPLQGGTHHVNEQWPEKWARLFRKRGYVPIDCVRGRVWRDDKVDWWYAQNTLLFVRETALDSEAALKREFISTNPNQLNLVHPRRYMLTAGADLAPHPPVLPSGVRAASRLLLICLRNSIRKRLSWILGNEAGS